MAIKTKKINDLGVIQLKDITALETSDVHLVGVQSEITGKVSTKELIKLVNESFQSAISELKNQKPTVSYDDSSLVQKITDANVKIKSLTTLTTQHTSKIDSANKRIAELENRCEKLEQFIKDLQKEGYLTLAEIRKAAVACCPVATTEETKSE